MRAALAPFLFTFVFTSSLFAIDRENGKIVQGKYFASGSASTAGVKVQYLLSKAFVNIHGNIIGNVTKTVTADGVRLAVTTVQIKGHVQNVTRKGQTFAAPGVVRLSDGVVVRGTFRGLADSSQRLSRYFRGKINGDPHSNFVLRAR